MSKREDACLAPSPTSCVAHTRAYCNGKLVKEGFHVESISDLLDEPGTVVWLDLLKPTAADLEVLVDELGLHQLAVEDALHLSQRPKIDRYHDHLFMAAYGVRIANGEVETSELAAFLTPQALVTVRADEHIDLAPILARWDAAPELVSSGVTYLAHGLVDVLVDGYVEVTQELDAQSDAVEESLFEGPSAGEIQRRTFAIRSSVAKLRHVVLPMREVVATLHRPDVGLVDDQIEPYLHDVDDHVQRAIAGIESIRDQLATILDTTIALQGQRLNETIFKLTAYAAILAVTTAITGFFGQNVPFPGFGEDGGFYGSLALLAVSVLGLVVFFKKRGWL